MRFIVALVAFSLLPMLANAADFSNKTPLVTVRFNQSNVYYEKALYQAVVKAAEIKPTVMFDVVGVNTSSELDHVLATMNNMGIPSERITVTTLQGQTPSPEVRVYVK